MEICQRCKEEGEDRRTLWMACMYDMAELDISLERIAVKGKAMEYSHAEDAGIGFGIKAHIFKDIPDAKEFDYRFFTMRVCKGCRADWMHAIRAWFNTPPEREPEGEFTSGSAYVRDLGSNRRVD